MSGNKSREAMQLALEALESDPISHAGLVSRKQAITALRQALETEREWVGLTREETLGLFEKYSDSPFSLMLEALEKVKEKNT